MNSSSLEICAIVGQAEQLMVEAAVRLLSECLQSAGAACVVNLTCWGPIRSDFLIPDASAIPEELHVRGIVPRTCRHYHGPLYQAGRKIVVLSLLTDLLQTAKRHRQEHYRFLPLPCWERAWTAAQAAWVENSFIEEPAADFARAAERWQAIVGEIERTSRASVFVCNIFRHVPEGLAHRYFGAPLSLGEQVRQWNLLGIELSHATGVAVVDLDRALANWGSVEMKTDYLMTGPTAASVGAETLVSTLFKAGLDEFLTPEIQAAALAHFESRQAAIDWLSAQKYQTTILSFLADIREIQSRHASLDPAGMLELGNFLSASVEKLKAIAADGSILLHREFVSAIRDLGSAHVALAHALSKSDAATAQQLKSRIQNSNQRLLVFWNAFNDFATRSGCSAG